MSKTILLTGASGGFGSLTAKALAANPAQDPQNVADAIVHLIDTPAEQRPFRTVVDKMGMGDHITKLNEVSEQITKGIYTAFHMDHMLKVQTHQ